MTDSCAYRFDVAPFFWSTTGGSLPREMLEPRGLEGGFRCADRMEAIEVVWCPVPLNHDLIQLLERSLLGLIITPLKLESCAKFLE